jgi:hypothetical protein
MRQLWAVRLNAAVTAAVAVCLLALAGCATGPAKRVSEPTASIQELAVGTDGRWTVALRLQNFSSVPMRFDRVALALRASTEVAGELQASPALTIGPESADVVTIVLTPSASARIVIADALADRRGLDYNLEGTISAAAKDRKVRDYKVKRNSALSPVPGLPGVMR